jgi:hypothetical protein
MRRPVLREAIAQRVATRRTRRMTQGLPDDAHHDGLLPPFYILSEPFVLNMLWCALAVSSNVLDMS